MQNISGLSKWVVFWGVACVLVLFAGAQVERGRIVGVVQDSSHAVIRNASVTITNEQTSEQRSVSTDQDGYYAILGLQPAIYSLHISAAGFAAQDIKQIRLSVGQEQHHDFVLNVTASTEVVVTEEGTPALDTSSARIGINVNAREVGSLPINGRQLSQLALQAPGSVNSGSGTFNDIRFSGRANQQNAIRYDGVEGTAIIDAAPGNLNGEIPSPFKLQTSLENVQEFRVESNSFPAEYGTGTGGQVSVITKSGGNRFHGSAFEFVRNDVFDASNFFDNVKKSKLRLNQFGGSIGGPIIRDKFFFFASYEGYRLRSGVNFVEAVPSAAARARAVPAVVPLLDAFKDPRAIILPGASTNPDFDIALQSNNIVDENSGGLRLDYKINDRHSVYARYFRDQGTNDQPEGVTGRHALVRSIPQNAVLSLVSLFGSNLMNDLKFGYNGALTRINGVAPTVNGIDLSALTINVSGSVANSGIAGQGASSGIAVPGGLLRQNSATNGRGAPYTPYSLSYIDSLSWQRGKQSLKFGGEVRMLRLYTDRQGGTTYTYQNLNDFLANVRASVQFLADVSAPSPFNSGATGNRLAKQEYYIGYAQDEWRVRPDLTLNLGLRYEYYTPMREDRNLDVIFDTVRGILLPPNRDFYHASTTSLAPRIGFSWSPSALGSHTVVRAGFGLFYGPGQTEDLIQPIESDRISSTLSGQAFPVNPVVLTANFINNPLNRSYQPRAYAPEYTVPERIAQYTLSVQQELPSKTTLTVGYVGSQGRNLFLRNFTNRIVAVRTIPPSGAGNPTAVIVRQFDIDNGGTNVLRPFAEVDFKTSGGTDDYNALQASIVRRMDHGLTLSSQYTFSKSLGTSSGSNEALTTGNPFNYRYDRGLNAFDVRHTFNLSFLYELPFGHNKHWGSSMNGIAEAFLGNWQVGSIFNARSGVPIDVRVVRPDIAWIDAAGNVFGSAAPGRTAIINTPGGGASRNVRRPDVVPGVNPFLDSGRLFLNPAAFATPAPGQFGNLRRGALHGPNFNQLDFTVTKYFPVTESANVEFRMELFNILNHPNFANPPATLPNALGTDPTKNQVQPGQPFSAASAGTFGILNSTVTKTVGLGTNRQIQFALRLNF